MNKIEALKQELDGLDVLPRLLRYAAASTPPAEIPEDDLQRMKWYGVFHRPQKPGTFMMRLRVTGGRLTSRQLRTLAGISARFGGGTADFTTRQNVQFHDIALGDVPAIFSMLDEAGLSSRQTGLDNVRNFVGCPLAGIDGLELFDSTGLLRDLAEAHLAAGKQLSNLPRKFNVSAAGCRDDCGHAQTQDLGLVPATRDIDGHRTAGFNVLVGGALGGTSPRLATPLDVFLTLAEVVPFFLALLGVYRDHGPREVRTKARLKWLLDAWGEARLRGAVEAELGSPLRPAGVDERLQIAGDHLGVHAQRQVGLNYAGLHVPVGRVSADQLTALAGVAEAHGRAEVRLTVDQNVVIPHVPNAALPALLAEPLLEHLSPEPSPAWRNLVACTGNDYCHYSLIDTKRHAFELAAELDRRRVEIPEGTRIYMSGCVHACGKHHVGDIGMQGANVRLGDQVVEAVDLYYGGSLGPAPRLAAKANQRVVVTELASAIEAHLGERAACAVPAAPQPVHSGEES